MVVVCFTGEGDSMVRRRWVKMVVVCVKLGRGWVGVFYS